MEEKQKHFWLYTLLLEDGKYYVGITTRSNPDTRIGEHGSYLGARWCKKHKPIKTLEKIDLGVVSQEEAEAKENEKLFEYMDSYGFWNVRGGKVTYSGLIIPVTRRTYISGWTIETAGTALLLFILTYYIQATR